MANEDTFHLGVKALIKNEQGQILVLHTNPKLLAKNVPDHWDLPSGRMQKGQTIIGTLEREVEEEIGVKKFKIIKLLDVSISNMRIDIHGLILFTYLCEIDDHSTVKLTDDEHSEFKWVSPKEAAQLIKVKFSDECVKKIAKL